MHREEKSLCKPLRQREVEVKLHPFLTTVLDGIVSCSYRDSKCNCSCRAACSLVTVLTIGINNCTANCTLHHVVQKPYQGVLDFKNITSFYGTSLYVISFTPVIYIYIGTVLFFDFFPPKNGQQQYECRSLKPNIHPNMLSALFWDFAQLE